MQQRGINAQHIDVLLDYGQVEYHRGRELFYLTKASLARLQREQACTPQELDKVRNTYLVVDGDELVTVGHKRCHFKRDRKH
jgi:hypothetical protein